MNSNSNPCRLIGIGCSALVRLDLEPGAGEGKGDQARLEGGSTSADNPEFHGQQYYVICPALRAPGAPKAIQRQPIFILFASASSFS